MPSKGTSTSTGKKKFGVTSWRKEDKEDVRSQTRQAIQEQQDKIKEVQERLEMLKQKVSSLLPKESLATDWDVRQKQNRINRYNNEKVEEMRKEEYERRRLDDLRLAAEMEKKQKDELKKTIESRQGKFKSRSPAQ